MKIITSSNKKQSLRISKKEWESIGEKAGWTRTAGAVEGNVNPPFDKLEHFFRSMIKGNGGYFTNKDKEKYISIRDKALSEINNNRLSDSGSIEIGESEDTISFYTSYTINFGDRDYGNPLSKKGSSVLNIFKIDKKGVVSHITIGKGGTGVRKDKFTRDENYILKTEENFDDTLEVGAKIVENGVYYLGKMDVKFGQLFKFMSGENELVVFGNKISNEVLKVLRELDNSFSNWGKSKEKMVNMEYTINEKKIYQNKLSYIISIDKLEISEISKKLKHLKNVNFMLAKLTHEEIKEINEKHLSETSTTTSYDLAKDIYDSFNKHLLQGATST